MFYLFERLKLPHTYFNSPATTSVHTCDPETKLHNPENQCQKQYSLANKTRDKVWLWSSWFYPKFHRCLQFLFRLPSVNLIKPWKVGWLISHSFTSLNYPDWIIFGLDKIWTNWIIGMGVWGDEAARGGKPSHSYLYREPLFSCR